MTTVVIADDQELIRSGLRLVLEAQGITVLGEAAHGRDAVGLAREHTPDVVLMDIRMPVMDGIAATAELVRLGLSSRVLILTTYDLDEYVYGALRAGAAGFLLKSAPADKVAAGVETVAAGDALLAPSLTRRLIEDHIRLPSPAQSPAALQSLTEREHEVLVLMARGMSNGEIAAQLVVAEATVKTHVNRILGKLGLQGRVQAVVLAYETGLIRPGG